MLYIENTATQYCIQIQLLVLLLLLLFIFNTELVSIRELYTDAFVGHILMFLIKMLFLT